MMHLYPRIFRTEFKEEMTAVFAQAVVEAAKRGWLSVTAVFLRELRDLPPNIAREHWRSLTKGEIPMITIRKKPEWFFYPAWIIFQALAIPIAFILSFAIVLIALKIVGGYIYLGGVRYITEDYLFNYIFFPTNILMMGLLQYVLLRRYLPRMGAWILVTVAGGLVGTIFLFGWFSVAPYFGEVGVTVESWAIDSVFIFLGFSVGVGQWLLLRRRLPKAGWWIVANIVGWGVLRLVIGNTLDQFDIVALGVLPACATAVALAFLINQAAQSEPQAI